MTTSKIATCCYCGTRAALVLKGRERHELSCSACGAPLHEMKMLRADHPHGGGVVRPSPLRTAPAADSGRMPKHDPRRRKGKKRKGLGRRFLEEAFDLIEDIFD